MALKIGGQTHPQFSLRPPVSFGGILVALAILVAVVLALSGCAGLLKPTNDIRFNRGAFTAAYIRISRVQAVAEAELTRFCIQEKDLKASIEMCRDLAELNRQYYVLDKIIMRSITDPEGEVDWQAVADLLDVIIKLAVKVGAVL